MGHDPKRRLGLADAAVRQPLQWSVLPELDLQGLLALRISSRSMRSLIDDGTELLWAFMLAHRLPAGVFPPAKDGFQELLRNVNRQQRHGMIETGGFTKAIHVALKHGSVQASGINCQALVREQRAVEKRRQVPGGGHYVVIPSAGACRTGDWSLGSCGPDGVPLLLGQFDMLDNTAQLRLLNLTTGASSVLITTGRHPDEPSSDEDDEEEEDGSEGEGEANQEDSAASQPQSTPLEDGVKLDTASEARCMLDAATPHVSSPDQPTLPQSSMAGQTVSTRPAGESLQAASKDPSLQLSTSQSADAHCSDEKHLQASVAHPQAASPSQPVATQMLDTQHLPHLGLLRGLGLQDEIDGVEILEGPQHVFVRGRPLSGPRKLVCWQVLSIPDGRTKALSWHFEADWPETWCSIVRADRYVIRGVGHHTLEVFDVATLQQLCTIYLQQAFKAATGQQLVKADLLFGQHETYLPVEVAGATQKCVLVFDLATGQLRTSYCLPASHTKVGLEWMATEPWPILAISSHQDVQSDSSAEARARQSIGLTAVALHIKSSRVVPICKAGRGLRQLRRILQPAAGGCLVAALQHDLGKPPELLVKETSCGKTVYRIELNQTQDPFPGKGNRTHWSEVWEGCQSLYLPCTQRVYQFERSNIAPDQEKPGQREQWVLSKRVRLSWQLFVVRLSPDGNYVVALKASYNEAGQLSFKTLCALVHINLADGAETTVVEHFEYGEFILERMPGQRLVDQRVYLLPDYWHRIFICDCASHCVLHIVETRPWPLDPLDCQLSGIFQEDKLALFTPDGRAVIMKAARVQELHLISWRSQATDPNTLASAQ
ncbi:hypothetical protein WJX74_008177 [Apatococcus lobatus]|uniref:F-box domain-containing protein n=1 Tax=Apatococcus lobatus TaxID=904363 RepID=A0AAW1RZ57_9CHLO